MPDQGAAAPFDLDRGIEFEISPHLTDWMAEAGISFAFTTYQTSRLFLIGRRPGGAIAVTERVFPRAMGLWSDGQTMWLSTLYQLWRFENVLGPGESYEGHDRMYAPRLSYVTGAVNVHDVAVGDGGRPVFVATQFNCLAVPSGTHNFRPIWRPPFISALVPEDRCHLNGLAMRAGRPSHVTALSESDEWQGWRGRRGDGGCVIDVASGATVLRGVSIPHSPRWVDDALWLLESGTGRIGRADLAAGRFEPVAFCPGYVRGFAVAGRHAIVGLSLPRRADAFAGLALDDTLKRHALAPRCGFAVIDLVRGEIAHWLWLKGFVSEIYDVVVLPGVARPMALGFATEQIQVVLTVEGMTSPLQGPRRNRDAPDGGLP